MHIEFMSRHVDLLVVFYNSELFLRLDHGICLNNQEHSTEQFIGDADEK